MTDVLGKPGVEVVGAVEDLTPEYDQASFAVVPIKEGAGTKIKVAEALAFGRAVIAYQHSVRGYELVLGKGLLSASNDEEMVAACLELFAAPDRRDAMAIQGHAIACASFSYARFQHEVVETTRRVALMTPSQAALQP
jgi:glycosyltransferase involved in cell wall biosynthesis